MSYTPPLGDQAGFSLENGYTPPYGTLVSFALGEQLELVETDYDIFANFAFFIESGCEIIPVDVSGSVEAICEVITIITDIIIEDGYELVRAEALDTNYLVVRSDVTRIESSCLIVRKTSAAIENSCSIVRDGYLTIDSACEIKLFLPTVVIDVGYNIDCGYLEKTPIEVAYNITTADNSWSTLIKEQILYNIVVSGAITVSGEPIENYNTTDIISGSIIDLGQTVIEPVNLNFSIDRSSYVITGSIELADSAQYNSCLVGRNITFPLGLQNVVLRISDRRRIRSNVDWKYIIDVSSPAAWLDSPWAVPIDDTVEFSGTASSIATAIINTSGNPVPISWQTVDWYIPSDVLLSSGRTPLELLRSLKDAPGAVIQSELDGSLVVEPEYPISVPYWTSSTPALVISEGAEVISSDEDEDWRNGNNAYWIGNESSKSSSSQFSITDIDNDDGSKTIRVSAVPWRTDIALEHRGGDWVQLSFIGDVIREETQTVQIIEGSGNTSYPIQNILSYDWLEYELGTLSFDEDGTITSSIVGESLVSVTYTTLSRDWNLRTTRNEEIMVVATTSDSSYGTGTSTLVTRGSGDKVGTEIVDPLILNDIVAIERGRNEIDASFSSRQLVTLTCLFTGLYRTGILVQVLGIDSAPWVGMLRSQNLSISVAEDGSQQWTNTLTLEREAV